MFSTLISLLAAAAISLSVPWATFSEIAKEPAAMGQLGVCPGGREFFRAIIPKGKEVWVYFFEPEKRRLVFVHFASREAEEADAVAFATVDKDAHDKIPELKWQVPAKDDNRTVCEVLFPAQT